MNTLKKGIALALALVMCVGLLSVGVFADRNDAPAADYKFAVKVSSVAADQSVGAVSAVVDSSYGATITVSEGSVNTSNVTGEIWMKNVASLGVTGDEPRYYGRTITLGETGQDVALTAVSTLFNQLANTKITAVVGENSVTYTFAGTDGAYTFNPDSAASASAVWHAIVDKNVSGGTGADDSYIVIAKGSSLQLGQYTLEFEDGANDLKLDNFSDTDAMNTAIRNAVQLTQDSGAEGTEFVAVLAAGTQLNVGSSYAKLENTAKLTVTGDAVTAANVGALSDMLVALQNGDLSAYGGDIYHALFHMLGQMVDMVKGKETTVTFEFGEEPEPEPTTYTVTFDANGGSAVEEQTVEENGTATQPDAPTRSGYTFNGWQLNGVAYDFAAPVTGDITLTASWTQDYVPPVVGPTQTPTQEPEVEIEEDEVPLAALPEGFEDEVTVEIDGEEVLLSDVELDYVDVLDDDWFRKAVAYTSTKRIMIGFDATHFGPQEDIDGRTIATILYRLLDGTEDTYGENWDVPGLNWVEENDLAADFEFSPDEYVTREQIITMIYRAAQLKGYDVSDTADYSSFEDADTVSEFAQDAMGWAIGINMVKGYGGTNLLNASGNLSRCEAATFFLRIDVMFNAAEEAAE